jgi:hypothetical protein
MGGENEWQGREELGMGYRGEGRKTSQEQGIWLPSLMGGRGIRNTIGFYFKGSGRSAQTMRREPTACSPPAGANAKSIRQF